MTDEKKIRLSQLARKLNVGASTIVEKLSAKGEVVDDNPNTKITLSQLTLLAEEFNIPMEELGFSKEDRLRYSTNVQENEAKAEEASLLAQKPLANTEPDQSSAPTQKTPPSPDKLPQEKEEETIRANKNIGLKVLGKIDLDAPKSKPSEANTTKKIELPPAENKKVSEAKPAEKKNRPQEINPKPKIEAEPKKPEVLQKAPETPKPEEKKLENPKEVLDSKPIEESITTPTPKPVPTTSATPVAEAKPKEMPPLSNAKSEPDPSPKPGESNVVVKEPDAAPAVPNPVASVTTEATPAEVAPEEKVIKAEAQTLKGLTILGKIELPTDKNRRTAGKPVASSDDKKKKRKRKKKRIGPGEGSSTEANQNPGQNTQQDRPKTPQTPGKEAHSHHKPASGQNQGQNSNNASSSSQQGSSNQGAHKGKNQSDQNQHNNRHKRPEKPKEPEKPKPTEISNAEIQDQIKATMAKLSNKNRISKKPTRSQRKERLQNQDVEIEDENVLQVTEFISANDLASLMDVSVTEIISTCLSMGLFVSINQRLDAEAIDLIASEFGYKAEFISAIEEDSELLIEEPDKEEDLEPRAPIVTIMGHVDHGKTSLLDYIRNTNVTSQESGGITQHIGAYDVETTDGRRVVFLDTPGHEAFTAMRARGAKVTDIVILVVAADDSVMPQTKEAINHAQVAGVPIVIAINKIDKSTAEPEKIRKELANENILVESWGGKYQDQEISAKTGLGIDDLLEKVLLEADLLELKANGNKKATGTVIEASLDKGRGYVATVLVQTGTLKVGDVILAGSHYGRVKAMNNHLGKRLKKAGPATPVQVLGLNGAPQAGDILKAMDSEREAREIANKREQILREQNIRATRGLTLEEIGRRRLLGNFQELKIIVKGDVDGSVEALSDSLLKLSTQEIEIKIIHKAVGQISEADVMLASASEAIIVGFQVRPSQGARRAAEQEKVQIKLYSVIYNAIEEIRDAMEGMLAPTLVEEIVGNAEVRNIFRISKVGTVAGCYVTDGYIKRTNRIRLVRDGIVIYEGDIDALKRFKEDVNEVKTNFECGISIKSFNDIQEGDVIESFEQKEVKRKLV
ncbi:MAG: translation initiation factor IF-2 [Microscillaceae bacterium]